MKQILKKTAPVDFENWKASNQENISRYIITESKSGDDLWNLLQSSQSKETIHNDYSKAQLRSFLIKEQFYLCCYCNDLIKNEALSTKIEHFLPKGTYKAYTFNYDNLFAACNGGERMKPVELSCDSYKGERDPSVGSVISPLDSDIDIHFKYKESGEIVGLTQKGIDTINFFNLDCKRLRIRRKTVIENYIYEEIEDIDDQMDDINKPSLEGYLQPFSAAVIYILNQYR